MAPLRRPYAPCRGGRRKRRPAGTLGHNEGSCHPHREELVIKQDDIVAHCLALPGAWEDEPWDGDTVAKVGTRIFAFLGSGDGRTLGLKCGATRDEADEWLHRFPDEASVMPYLGRYGWNTLRTDGSIPEDELLEAIDTSYASIASRLPRRERP